MTNNTPVKTRRIELGYTQQRAAALAQVSLSTWQAYEKNADYAGSPLTDASICKALGWPVDALERIRAGETIGDPAVTKTPAPTQLADLDEPADPLATILTKLEMMDYRYGDMNGRVDVLSQEHGQLLIRVGQLERKVDALTR